MNSAFKTLPFGILLLCLFSSGVGSAEPNSPKIIDHLMDQSKVSRPRGTNHVDTIMLHFSSDVAAHQENPYDPERNIAIYAKAGVSAHYLIDRQGNIYRLVPENQIAYHAGKGVLPFPPYRTNTLNNFSIGIELLGISSWQDMKMFISKDKFDKVAKKDIGFTDAQYKSLQELIASIRTRWPEIGSDRHHIIGHSEYAPSRRTDPGVLFNWTKIGLPANLPKD